VGRDRTVTLAVEGPGIAPEIFAPAGGEQGPGTPFDFVAAAPRPIRGVVRDKATGRPLAGVRVSLQLRLVGPLTDATLTDKDGRYELRGPPTAREPVVAQPQPGQPYFSAVVPLPRAPGPGHVTTDFELVRGAPLRGRVTDGATGRPPKRAVVEYYPLPPNAQAAALPPRNPMVPASSSPLGPDGSYSLAVLPGPGIVLVAASPRDSYATARLDARELAALCEGAADGGASAWAHIADRPALSPARAVDRYNALALINPDGAAPGELDFTLNPARPLRGTVVGPDGEPLAAITVCGLTSMPDPEVLEGAAFTVEGLNPEVPRPLSFYHEEKRLGKALTLRGGQTEALTVRLEPCGEVIGRVLDRDGRPVAGMRVCFGRPGNDRGAPAKTDAQGRFRATLVPGLKYRVPRCLTRDYDELEVRPGQVRDLADLFLTD
jgi:hypothetical protein